MKNDRQPQRDADCLRRDVGSPKDDYGTEIIQQHRGYHSSRRATLYVAAGEPAGDTQSEQRCSGYPSQGDGRTGNFGSKQQLDDDGGHDQQRQADSCFNHCGHGEQMFHPNKTGWDNPTPSYSGSLPRQPRPGHIGACGYRPQTQRGVKCPSLPSHQGSRH